MKPKHSTTEERKYDVPTNAGEEGKVLTVNPNVKLSWLEEWEKAIIKFSETHEFQDLSNFMS